jgi:hypothetical protein
MELRHNCFREFGRVTLNHLVWGRVIFLKIIVSEETPYLNLFGLSDLLETRINKYSESLPAFEKR